MLFPRFFIFILVSGPMLSAGSGPKITDLKLFQSQHLSIYTTGEYKQLSNPLVNAGEEFLGQLEKRWSIKLPATRFAVTLARGEPRVKPGSHIHGPPWLNASYSRKNQRVDLILTVDAPEDPLPQLIAALHHLLVHRVLDLNQGNQLPVFLEEGLAQHYGNEGETSDTSIAIWALNLYPSLSNLLLSSQSFNDEKTFPYAAAISKRYVLWLWQTRQGAEIPFLQKFLSNRPVEKIYKELGWPENQVLVQQFQDEVGPHYQWHALLFTYDFWLIFAGLLLWLWMVWKIIQALHTARMKFVAETMASAGQAEAVLFRGPAFDPRAQLARGVPGVPANPPPDNPLPDRGSALPPGLSLPPMPPGQVPLPPDVTLLQPGPISPPALPQSDLRVDLPSLPQGAHPQNLLDLDQVLGDVEQDLDNFFDEIIGETHPVPARKARKNDEIEENLDEIFDQWQE